jgi:hypothetical protein
VIFKTTIIRETGKIEWKDQDQTLKVAGRGVDKFFKPLTNLTSVQLKGFTRQVRKTTGPI